MVEEILWGGLTLAGCALLGVLNHRRDRRLAARLMELHLRGTDAESEDPAPRDS